MLAGELVAGVVVVVDDRAGADVAAVMPVKMADAFVGSKCGSVGVGVNVGVGKPLCVVELSWTFGEFGPVPEGMATGGNDSREEHEWKGTIRSDRDKHIKTRCNGKDDQRKQRKKRLGEWAKRGGGGLYGSFEQRKERPRWLLKI